MDKLDWLKKMVELNSEDPQAHYFYGKELAENGRFVEAVQSLSTAISKCSDETLKMEFIQELTKVSLMMSEGNNEGASRGSEFSKPQHDLDQFTETVEEEAYADERIFTTFKEETVEEEHIDHSVEIEEKSIVKFIEDDEKTLESMESEVEEGDFNTEKIEHVEYENREHETSDQMKVPRYGKPRLEVVDGGEASPVKKERTTITFDDVAGLEDLKKTINLRIISPFYNKGLFAKFRKKAGGGVLLYGPPGCGKTFIARATAGECKANFYPVYITDILNSYIGVSEQNLKDIFIKARFQKPSILFFDEVDTIGFSRAKTYHEYNRGVIDTFLMELDGIDSTDEVLVIAATNTPWDVDNALKRPGRFDRLIFVAPPDEKAREEIFRLKLKGRYAEAIDVARLASITEFFSGADIENVVELATERVLDEILTTGIERPIRTNDLVEVVKNTQPSTIEWLRTAKNYVKYANQGGQYNDVEAYLRKYGKRLL